VEAVVRCAQGWTRLSGLARLPPAVAAPGAAAMPPLPHTPPQASEYDESGRWVATPRHHGAELFSLQWTRDTVLFLGQREEVLPLECLRRCEVIGSGSFGVIHRMELLDAAGWACASIAPRAPRSPPTNHGAALRCVLAAKVSPPAPAHAAAPPTAR
jgi:hypothetical protein